MQRIASEHMHRFVHRLIWFVQTSQHQIACSASHRTICIGWYTDWSGLYKNPYHAVEVARAPTHSPEPECDVAWPWGEHARQNECEWPSCRVGLAGRGRVVRPQPRPKPTTVGGIVASQKVALSSEGWKCDFLARHNGLVGTWYIPASIPAVEPSAQAQATHIGGRMARFCAKSSPIETYNELFYSVYLTM